LCILIIQVLRRLRQEDLNFEASIGYIAKPCIIKKRKKEKIPRWWLEGGSRKRASYSEILERRWRHTLQAKPLRRGKTLTPPHIHPLQRISTSC
jgi:hypothetical protein